VSTPDKSKQQNTRPGELTALINDLSAMIAHRQSSPLNTEDRDAVEQLIALLDHLLR
jgi:hypothetical protein